MADIEKKDIGNTEESAPAEKAVAKTKKSDKPSVPSRIAAWFKSCKSEMKKIVWAAPNTVLRNSLMVIAAIVVVAVVIGLLDYVFSAGIVSLNKII